MCYQIVLNIRADRHLYGHLKNPCVRGRSITGDDGVGLGEPNIYHQLVDVSIMGDLNRKVVIK